MSNAREAIARLTAAGYKVVRQQSYDALLRRAQRAEWALADQREQNAATQAWAERAFDEQDALRARCDDLVEFALRHGASVDDLARFNDALHARRAKQEVTPS